jgi:hypothetical protein
MTTWNEVERRSRETATLGPHGGHAVVLSLVVSLGAVAIISKTHLVNSLWVDAAAFVVPIPIALYFENRILRLGIGSFLVAIALPLGAAVLFGI